MIVITGATGNIGYGLTRLLLAKGQKVRAVGREAKRLKPLVDQGAEGCIGDMQDTPFLTQAFHGAEAVFSMIPAAADEPDFRAYQNRISESLVEAVAKAGVGFVVNLSSLGAHLPAKTGPIMGLRDHEERLNGLKALRAAHLRPTYFMENLLSGIPVIKGMGVMGSPLKPDLSIPMIATRDIAAVAADVLIAGAEKSSQVRELLGPRDYTLAEATAILGKAIGKPGLKYVQFSYEDTLKAMMGAGMGRDISERMIEMLRSMNEGYLMKDQVRTKENTTPTTLEQFAPVFARIYNS